MKPGSSDSGHIGLMSFGGHGALFMTVLLIAAAALFQLSAGPVSRRLSVGFLVAFIAGSLLLPALFVALTTMTDIGQQILTHLYFDDSAEARVIQRQIVDLLKWQNFLFGMSPDRIEFLKAQIGLLKAGMDIENFWLLMFLNLGTIGFPFFAGALFLLLLHAINVSLLPVGLRQLRCRSQHRPSKDPALMCCEICSFVRATQG
jgi:hypothetical protein